MCQRLIAASPTAITCIAMAAFAAILAHLRKFAIYAAFPYAKLALCRKLESVRLGS